MRDFELTMRFDGIVFNCHGVGEFVRCGECEYGKSCLIKEAANFKDDDFCSKAIRKSEAKNE